MPGNCKDEGEEMMMRWIARLGLKRFARRYRYDTGYLETMLAASPGAFFKFSLGSAAAAHRKVTPVNAYFAVKMLAAAEADCGPCTQLCVEMAREAGMEEEQIVAVLEGRSEQLGADVRRACRFAQALVLAADEPDELAAARDAVRQRWGEAGVVELSLCWSMSQVFPVLKRAMGFAQQCRLVEVAKRPVRVVRHAG
jgi:alkylhydroperoxidase family enzyme